MKQEIDIEQWEQLSERQQEWLKIGTTEREIKHHSKYWTVGKSIEFIRHHHQLDICTANDRWFIYLYDLSDCAQCACDEGISCIYENDEKELIDALFEAVVWTLDRLMDR